MNVDFAPTFLDFAGVDIPSDIQGASLKPILVNEGKTPADCVKLLITIITSTLQNTL